MLNKRGFTLMNLLAVIVILGILASIASITVNNLLGKDKKVVFNNRKQTSELQVEIIKAASKNYVTAEGESLIWAPSKDASGYTVDVTLGDIQEKGYIDDNIVDPTTKQVIDSNITVHILKDMSNKITVTVPELEK